MSRFTIRELVLLTLAVAMGVGWWLDHKRLTWRADAAEAVSRVIITQHEQLFEVLDSAVPDWRKKVAESPDASHMPY